MGKTIQQVAFADHTPFYITGWDDENQILRYWKDGKRASEEVNIDEKAQRVMLSTCWFPLAFLMKFLHENQPEEETT